LRSIKDDIEKNTPGMSKKLNRSISIRRGDESLLEISDRIQDYKKRKSENLRKIINNINKVI